MATKKPSVKKKPVKAAKPSKKARKKGQGGMTALIALLVLVAAVVGAVLYMRPAAIKPITADVLASWGGPGKGEGQFDGPRGIAVDKNGNVYVADLGNNRVVQLGPDGRFVKSWGKKADSKGDSKGDKPGEFNEPSGVAVDGQGRVFVADAWNGRISVLGADGKYVGELTAKDNSFYSPRNVATDRSGNIYVADTGNCSVKAFGPALNKLKAFGERGKGLGRMDEVFGVAINSKGEVFAADPGNGRIHKFSALPAPKALAEVKVAGWQRGRPFWPHLAVDSQDRIYAVDGADRKIWVYSSDLKYLGTIGAQPGRELFAAPLGIAFGPDGSLYVSDQGRSAVLKLGNLQFPNR
jgi:tripartite motif-containing protein 71